MTHPTDRVLKELVDIYSPTGNEEKAVEYFGREMLRLGADEFFVDRAGNGVSTFSGASPEVLVCGHIDTVPGELPVREDGNTLYGRGTTDAKSSLVSLMFGASIAKQRGFGGTIRMIAAVGEEGPGKGIMEVASSQPRSDYAIFGEPSAVTGITVGYRGRILLDLEFRSGQVHASAPWLGQSAVESAVEAWNSVRDKYGKNREFSSVSAALTSIRAGDADNMTPSNAAMTLDVRYPPSRKQDDVLSEILDLVKSSTASEPSFVIRSSVEPYVSGLKTSLISAFKESVRKNTGNEAQLLFKSGSGDMNILGSRWKIPCVTYGPGNPQLSHTELEEISLEDVWRSAEIVADALANLERSQKEGTVISEKRRGTA